jgi:hypothetical protein
MNEVWTAPQKNATELLHVSPHGANLLRRPGERAYSCSTVNADSAK